MSCDIGEVMKRLENELWCDYNYELCSFSNLSITSPTSQLILQPFCCFTYITAYSPTLPSLHLHHSSFSNPSIASPMSQLILQPFFCFSYITGSSLMSLDEPPMSNRTVEANIKTVISGCNTQANNNSKFIVYLRRDLCIHNFEYYKTLVLEVLILLVVVVLL